MDVVTARVCCVACVDLHNVSALVVFRYVSSRGYGVYRNTWAPGFYDFGTTGTVTTTGHNETDRFDAFYFGAPAERDFKYLLGAYTYLTGAPFMPPIYGLGLGDSDCYHNDRHNNNTRVVTAVADQCVLAVPIYTHSFIPCRTVELHVCACLRMCAFACV